MEIFGDITTLNLFKKMYQEMSQTVRSGRNATKHTMLQQQQLVRTSKHLPRSCKGHQEIPKLIAAVCNTCLKTVRIL